MGRAGICGRPCVATYSRLKKARLLGDDSMAQLMGGHEKDVELA